jgi:hypothetical protein
MYILVLFFWVILSFIIGYAASQKNRSFGGFFFLSLIISPLISLLVLIAVPKLDAPSVQNDSYVDPVSGKYSRVVFDAEFSEEWKTLTKYDDELREILNRIFEAVTERNEKAKIIDELKKVYKIKKEIPVLVGVSDKLLAQYKENGSVFN